MFIAIKRPCLAIEKQGNKAGYQLTGGGRPACERRRTTQSIAKPTHLATWNSSYPPTLFPSSCRLHSETANCKVYKTPQCKCVSDSLPSHVPPCNRGTPEPLRNSSSSSVCSHVEGDRKPFVRLPPKSALALHQQAQAYTKNGGPNSRRNVPAPGGYLHANG